MDGDTSFFGLIGGDIRYIRCRGRVAEEDVLGIIKQSSLNSLQFLFILAIYKLPRADKTKIMYEICISVYYFFPNGERMLKYMMVDRKNPEICLVGLLAGAVAPGAS